MWVNRGRLPHVLEPHCYREPAHYEREIDRLFVPGWHFVATKRDLAEHGDFVTLDAFGRPLLVRNDRGRVHAYLNVCAHRHSLLTSEPRGNLPVLRCQYHGWQYRPDGVPCNVREASCFAPAEKGAQKLRMLAVATCGQLVFVSLATDPVDLQAYVGPRTWSLLGELFGDDHVQIDARTLAHPANWKIPIENVLESYHVPVVHGGSFDALPSHAKQRHELGQGYSEYEDIEPPESRLYRFVLGSVRDDPTYRYLHHHCFPNLTIMQNDLTSYVQSVMPTSPTTAVSHIRLFSYRGGKRAAQKVAARVLASPLTHFTARVLSEDASLLGDVQRGISASPHQGVLGSIEERVFAFQCWLKRHTGDGEVPGDGLIHGASDFDAPARAAGAATDERSWP